MFRLSLDVSTVFCGLRYVRCHSPIIPIMSNSLYKYVGASYLDKVFSDAGHTTIKCSYPKDFNDPYALFLNIDFKEEPDALAFYQEAIGNLPQLPTTCFSRSPAIVPMWAHYAQNSKGVVVELDEDALVVAFPESGFGDIDYQDKPHDGLTDTLHRAHQIGKPRYVFLLNRGVFSAAYFTKTTSWAYELERRMLVRDSEIRRDGNLLLADVPRNCISSLIVGPRASDDTKRIVRDRSEELGCRYFEMRIGRSSANPFFLDRSGLPHTFDGSQLIESAQYCRTCQEPLAHEGEECSWCRIEDSHRNEAASRHPYRMLHHHGMLQSYIQDMDAIGRGDKK